MTISTILIFKFDRDEIGTVGFFYFIFFFTLQESVDISDSILLFLGYLRGLN
jgi:hypothetical protein